LEYNPSEAIGMAFLKEHWGAVAALFLTALYLYLQLLVWRKHGDDLMLTAGSIVVTSALWILMLAAISKYWKASQVSAKPIETPKGELARSVTPPQPAQQLTTSFPSLSALYGQVPQVTFNAPEWFRHAYYSPLTAEIENNIKIAAEQNHPGNREIFYARFIGVGLVSYFHDITWAYIYKSQLLMLTEWSGPQF
jgi:hypothetical protein